MLVDGLLQDLDCVFGCCFLEDPVADDQPGCVVLGCDPPAAVRELLPIHMPQAHAVLSLVADPLASLLLGWLRQCSTRFLQDGVDPVVRQLDYVSRVKALTLSSS